MNALNGGDTVLSGLLQGWGESLLRACWQGAILVVVVTILCRILTRLPANPRCILWWLVCLKLLLGLVWITPVSMPLLPASPSSFVQATGGIDPGNGSAHTALRLPKSAESAAPVGGRDAGASEGVGIESGMLAFKIQRLPVMAILFAAWLVGTLFRLTVSVIPLRRVQRLLATAHHDASDASLLSTVPRRGTIRALCSYHWPGTDSLATRRHADAVGGSANPKTGQYERPGRKPCRRHVIDGSAWRAERADPRYHVHRTWEEHWEDVARTQWHGGAEALR